MSAEDTAREIAESGVTEVTVAGRTTKFLDPRVALDVQDRLDRQALARRKGCPFVMRKLTMGGTQD